LAGCLTCLALAFSASTAFATFPGTNGRIAYSSGDGTIHTILPNGDGDVSTGEVGYGPAWSPDGQRIAFIRTVAFDPNRGGKHEIFSMAQDGSDVRRLTYLAGFGFPNLLDPSYSPSGRRIAFDKIGAVENIMTMRRDGSDLRRVGTGATAEWSPDGRWISYIVGPNGDDRSSIWAVHPDGTDKHWLVWLGSHSGSFADWAPSGKQFIFVRSREVAPHVDHYTTFVARADGSHVHRLPCDEGPPGIPFSGGVYSPDGRWLLGVRPNTRVSRTNLVKLNLRQCRAGNVVYKVIATGNDYPTVDWQPLPTG
jgi:Tol biopolymer transport system component